MKNEIKLYLVDDHNLFREGLLFLLSNSELNLKVYEATNGKEFLENVIRLKPDIVLMDIEMPLMNGIDATINYLQINPEAKIIALSMHANENFYSEMIAAGAKGFLLKNSKFDDVLKAITEVYEGKNYFSPEILNAIITNLNKKRQVKTESELSKREELILYNICKGLSNREIAQNLNLSKRTVDKHRENILSKTQSKNTAALVIYAIKNKLFKV